MLGMVIEGSKGWRDAPRLGSAAKRKGQFALKLIMCSAKEFSKDDCPQLAASISYYVLFSIFPLLIFVMGVLGLVLRDSGLQQDVIDAVLDFLPLSEIEGRKDVTEAVQGVAGYRSGALGIVGILGMAWSGSSMFAAIRKSINLAYDLENPRPIIQQKLVDLGMVVGFGLFFLASIAATTFMGVALRLGEDVPVVGSWAEHSTVIWLSASLLIPFLLSFSGFVALYWLAPAVRLPLRDIWPGALLAALLFELVKNLFGIYLQNFGNYDVVFGSLGGVAAFLFWVYVSAAVMLFGAEVVSEYPRLRTEPVVARQGKFPMQEPALLRLAARVKQLFVHPDDTNSGRGR